MSVVNSGPIQIVPARAQITLAGVIAVAGAAVVLRLAEDVFLPLAIAMLITFALSPLVTVLRRLGLSLLLSVLLTTALAFAAIGLFSLVVFGQLGELAANLPTFQGNIMTKLTALENAGSGSKLISNALHMVQAIDREIGAAMPDTGGTAPKPLQVQMVSKVSATGLIEGLIVPILGPIATAFLVVVLVIFMLLERETLRDRFIRLVGSSDMHSTTQMLGDAGSRVASYLLMQLLVNSMYALPIGVGLWLIGVPQAVLWGVLTLVLRFIPFIGSALAAAFPLFLAFAISPDWSAVLWTGALFIVVETITANAIEPWLYGSRTGLSGLAIIIAALFWTFIWGPPGLVMATPLTVCLVVLGRHIPQFAFFDILLGDEPVLAPQQQLYQRLLTGNRVEVVSHAENSLADQELIDFYQDIALPALIMAQDDRDRGVLTPEQEARLAATALYLVNEMDNLTADAQDEAQTARSAAAPADIPHVTCIGGRWEIDDITAIMLTQLLEIEGATASALSFADLAPSRFAKTLSGLQGLVLLSFLDPNPSHASLLNIRRIKRASPQTRVGVVIWDLPPNPSMINESGHRRATLDPGKSAEAMAIGADFVVTSFEAALEQAFILEPATPLPATAGNPKANKSVIRMQRPATSPKPAPTVGPATTQNG